MHPRDVLGIQGARRNLKQINQVLADCEPHALMNAFFRNSVYGPYAITGTISVLAHGGLGIAGQSIETGTGTRRPVPELFALAPASDELVDGSTSVPSAQSLARSLSGVGHGDLVEAFFDQKPYGRFTLTGMALDAPAAGVLVLGSWFLTRSASTYAAAERLASFTIVIPAAEHGGPVPARIHRWPEPSPDE